MLRATNIVQPDGTKVTNVFSQRGELVRNSGSRTYPVGYAYDAQGRLKNMTNWSAFPSTGARVTTWHYDALRGWLTNKLDDSGLGAKYGYTDAGRLSTRLWARGTNTTYTYNNFGDLSAMDYSDATADLAYSYDRRGRPETVTQGANGWKLCHRADQNQPLVGTSKPASLRREIHSGFLSSFKIQKGVEQRGKTSRGRLSSLSSRPRRSAVR